MKYCLYCLTEVKDNADDCPSCGSEITNHKIDKLPEVEVVKDIPKVIKPEVKTKKGK